MMMILMESTTQQLKWAISDHPYPVYIQIGDRIPISHIEFVQGPDKDSGVFLIHPMGSSYP